MALPLFPKGALISGCSHPLAFFWVVWLYHSSLNPMGVELISTFGKLWIDFFEVLPVLPRSWGWKCFLVEFGPKKNAWMFAATSCWGYGIQTSAVKGNLPFKVFPVLPGNPQGAILCDIKIYFFWGIFTAICICNEKPWILKKTHPKPFFCCFAQKVSVFPSYDFDGFG